MGDSDPIQKKAGGPSWQSAVEDKPVSQGEKSASETPKPENRQELVDQAKKFLEEDEVRNASTDKKIAFLEGKGLQSDEIHQLLGITRNIEATFTPAPSSSSVEINQSSIPPPQTSYTPQANRDPPPVITYPEFLTTPTHPTPLITKPRLLATLYLFSGLSTILYGTKNFLVTPMLASLTTSRLSLAATAATNLTKLIEKLENTVSELPPTAAYKRWQVREGEEQESDDEDPTDLFHRDIGIQTMSESEIAARSHSPQFERDSDTASTIRASQVEAVSDIKGVLSEMMEYSDNDGVQNENLESSLSELRDYLDGLAYVTPQNYGYRFNSGGNYSVAGAKKEEDDEISKVKNSIRGVKGVLLSARSFPGGMRPGVR